MNISDWTRSWAEQKKIHFQFFPTIDSTNTECKRRAFLEQQKFLLCFADHQTGGRGRFDRLWQDHGFGAYLLSSWSYQTSNSPHPLITARVGLKVIESISKVYPIKDIALKAPNDIYIGSKKAGGILTESISQGDRHRLIIGFGLNVAESPKEENNSTSFIEAKVQMDANNWSAFLNELKTSFDGLAQTAHSNTLTLEERAGLLKHLNDFIGLKEKYTDVGENGDLLCGHTKMAWMDL